MADPANGAAANALTPRNIVTDLTAGLVVFLVALPLCLGIALASGAPLFSGLLAGIVGGLVVGSISGSQTSVSGPAAGLTAIVAAQIAALAPKDATGEFAGFDAFLLAVMLAGVIQIGLGLARAGELSAYFPTSVIKGLLAAIGVLLILKQFPHVLGHDKDPLGEMSLQQPDEETTFSELGSLFSGEIHQGAAVIGLASVALLVLWGRSKRLKNSLIPAPLVVVLFGVGMKLLFDQWGGRLAEAWGGDWSIGSSHLVQIPVAEKASEFVNFLQLPDFSQWLNPTVYVAAFTIAIVASLETLLNLDAVDELDPQKRHSPPSRELLAQGAGNIVCGLIGGLPVTSVIIRGSVNVGMGVKTKLSTIFHGALLLVCVALLPTYLNMIPLAALAAILLVTGFKLASPKLMREMWQAGRYQFAPFLVTVVAIVLTDLLIGILIGLTVAVLFILHSNLRRPVRRLVKTHMGHDVVHVELASQVSFLNQATLSRLFNDAPRGASLLIDATHTDYIDPDVLTLIRDFKNDKGPARGVEVRLRGFRSQYNLPEDEHMTDRSTPEMQKKVTPQEVLEILREGNRRFHGGEQLPRDLVKEIQVTAPGQSPLAVIVGCIDSRVPTELVFDLGIGDLFSVRVAGNVMGTKTLGSIEYAVKVSGVKLVLVLGHTRCGAVTSAVNLIAQGQDVAQATGCQHLKAIVDEIESVIDPQDLRRVADMSEAEREAFIDDVARRNVLDTARRILAQSDAVREAVDAGNALVLGALYDVKSGRIEFYEAESSRPPAAAGA